MAWNDNPMVRQAARLGKEHGARGVVIYYFYPDGKVHTVSWGKDKYLCNDMWEKAKSMGRWLGLEYGE